MIMMEALKNILAGNTKVKTTEQAEKEIAKLDTQEAELQSQLSQAQGEHSKVSNALEIISASLIIDEKDKQALATKKKAEAKLEELAKQMAGLSPKIAEVSSKKQHAVQELYRSRGEVGRKHNQKAYRDMVITSRFNRAFNIESDPHKLNAIIPKGIDLAVEYGLGEIKDLNPSSEDWKFIVKLGKEDMEEGNSQADVIAKELAKAIKGVFEKHNVELQKQSLINLSRI
ncbi:hypothetical protein CN941_30185 [Bacillus cereus]|nr:hypothetical protein IE3_02987 [Bacillus cereus BAG3X2-1]PET97842.1 hypothetical protein CN527_18515 [Bacillus cereus]PFE68199.1 hypothetical protein CN316_17940 [Bacillus cereus]PGL38961.1 hypothetical protein CN930_12640 [Bacillus cereus]PGM28613.1 hypothetical protein CN941_30185 [Bacillus cereus]